MRSVALTQSLYPYLQLTLKHTFSVGVSPCDAQQADVTGLRVRVFLTCVTGTV